MGYALGYNAFHKLESIGVVGRTSPLATYSYKEGNGRLKKITYANGDYMTATYNSLGQLVTEKWYDAGDTLTAHYRYAYDCNGNIVRSIDIISNVEYNYIYEDGRIVRATQCTVTLSGENIIARALDFAIYYVYSKDGKLVIKYTSEDDYKTGGTFYEYDKNDNTVVLRNENGKITASHSKTDSFGRKEFEELQLATGFVYRRFAYLEGETNSIHKENNKLKSSPTTSLVSEIILSDGHILSYEYDAEERITKVTDTDTTVSPNTSTVTEYTYDALGQLLTETRDGVTVNTMSYDNYGNITQKNGKSYTYDATWKDLLTSYDGQTIAYDAQGNPTTYLGHTLTWEKGRQLKSFDSNAYTYNANGIRTSKTVGDVKHTYFLDGAKILRETWTVSDTTNIIKTLWDNEDSLCGIKYNDTSYYFLKNLQGDVIAITDDNGDVVARYSYDAWGVCTVVSDTSDDNIATVNPFRYRGYYYDAEIGLYYLQSRYYNPVVGRFVNADEAENAVILGPQFRASLFCYVNNNPINNTDEDGYFSLTALFDMLKDICSKMLNKLKSFFASLIKVENGQVYINTAIISTTIDFIIALIISKWVEGAIKGILKVIVGVYFSKGGQKGIEIAKKILTWFAKGFGKFISTAIIKIMVGMAMGAMGLDTPSKSVINSVAESCISSMLTFENKLSQRISSLVSAFSSIGGLIAFLMDLSDFTWDDYWTPTAPIMYLRSGSIPLNVS